MQLSEKNNISFETTDSKTFNHNGQQYQTTTQQFGLVEHNKENLLDAFDQILLLLEGDKEAVYLHRFFFDIIDETTGLGQYTLQYAVIYKQEEPEAEITDTEELPQEDFEFSDEAEELAEQTEISEETYTEPEEETEFQETADEDVHEEMPEEVSEEIEQEETEPEDEPEIGEETFEQTAALPETPPEARETIQEQPQPAPPAPLSSSCEQTSRFADFSQLDGLDKTIS